MPGIPPTWWAGIDNPTPELRQLCMTWVFICAEAHARYEQIENKDKARLMLGGKMMKRAE